jgi:hypothetical protein
VYDAAAWQRRLCAGIHSVAFHPLAQFGAAPAWLIASWQAIPGQQMSLEGREETLDLHPDSASR